MLAQEENVEVHALRRRGWSISAIARHVEETAKRCEPTYQGNRSPGSERQASRIRSICSNPMLGSG